MYTNNPDAFLKGSNLSGPPNYLIIEEPCTGENCAEPIANMFLPFLGILAIVFGVYYLAPVISGNKGKRK